jgi:hypothetical protein
MISPIYPNVVLAPESGGQYLRKTHLKDTISLQPINTHTTQITTSHEVTNEPGGLHLSPERFVGGAVSINGGRLQTLLDVYLLEDLFRHSKVVKQRLPVC